jgi:H+-transporting ATPase
MITGESLPIEAGAGVDTYAGALSVVAIVFGGQATIYAIRSRGHLWELQPTKWLVLSSIADILIISILAVLGIAMAPLPIYVVASEFAGALFFGLVLDSIKIPVLARLSIS